MTVGEIDPYVDMVRGRVEKGYLQWKEAEENMILWGSSEDTVADIIRGKVEYTVVPVRDEEWDML